MYKIFICAIIVLLCCNNVKSNKVTTESLDNYNVFFNYGDKKISKLQKNKLENAIIKSKVDVLGEVFKKHIDSLKLWPKLDIVFLIDASSSVGEKNFKSELKFVKKLLSDVVVDYDHSRIAVVTFSSKNSVITNIDEITIPTKENNKCLLLNNELNDIKYIGGDTYTVGAFRIAKDIFMRSRNDTKKILFLITDGYSNGGDPIPLANELKKQYVTIFTIGVKNGNYKELYHLSSSPGEFYSYLLDSFTEFESLARRALHVDIKDGDYLPLGTSAPCSKLCKRGNCCDENAICTCGTSTGHYTCLCNPGYYGSGLRNSCFSCPIGSFADGPNVCLPCPDINHITVPPALGMDSCQCKPGYRATKHKGCETIKCAKLSPPQHGYFVKRKECGNVLNNACGVRCEVGYTLIGSSIRLCQMNATWSGEPPSCQVKTCPSLPAPTHGLINCRHSDLGATYNDSTANLPVDTACTFSCGKGRLLIGSSQRTCLPLAQWDGLKASCKQIKCNKLSNIPFGTIEPKSCTTSKQSFGKKCSYSCLDGFKLNGPSDRLCTGGHGTWSNKLTKNFCEDISPPALICPSNIHGSTNVDRNFGTVSWPIPNVTDNSGLNVTIWLKPAIIKIDEFKFKLGKTKVTYFAQDAYHNTAQCNFTVEIKDKQPPTIEDCVDPVPFLSTDNSGVNITWDEPNIFDNSDFVMISQSHEFGFFNIGLTQVTYTAKDTAGNTNSCILNITVFEMQCAPLPDPIFGRSDCTSLDTGIQCVVTCQEGYAIPISSTVGMLDIDNSTLQFICDHSDPVWYSKENNIFPDCTITKVPVEIFQQGVITVQSNIEEDICNNTKALNEIENEIRIDLNNNLRTTCNSGVECNVSTNTACENQDHSEYEEKTNIIKREVAKKRNNKRKNNRVNVEFAISARIIDVNNLTNLQPLANLENIRLLENSNCSKVVGIRVEKKNVVCPVGFVRKKLRCVQCPKGTFYNNTKRTCQSCPIGFYNDKPGQNSCIICPVNHSTAKLHSKSINDCKAHCPPGTHSKRKKLKPSKHHPNTTIEHMTLIPYCRTCRIGYYQPNYGQLSCRSCPNDYTTLTRKSTNLKQCVLATTKVCNNNNICNKGKCVEEDSFYYSCSCGNQYIGSHCETKLNICSSNPCLNDGRCISDQANINSFSCTCREGYSGQLCEEIEDKCGKKCHNDGKCEQNDEDEEVCVCTAGYGGEFCENKISYCTSGLCEHGTCLEQPYGYHCLCESGFMGKRCNILPCDYQPCSNQTICVNLNEANATKLSYRCECPKNYNGETCSNKIDYCSSNPCLNNGICVNTEENYKCECQQTFHGVNCQNKLNSDYILRFPRSGTTDHIKLNGFTQNLTEISTCLWMITNDQFNYGTILSYATYEYDNTFTLTDYTGLVLYVNGQHIITDVYLNDGFWHFFCVTWSSVEGALNIYKDGNLVYNGKGLANNTVVQGGGKMVIGQEQDVLGGRFSQSESFLGEISYLDIWSRILNDFEINQHMNTCELDVFGNVYAWAEIKNFIHGDVEILPSTFCKNCETLTPLENGYITVVANKAYYKCNDGYELSTSIYNSGRKCNKASKWVGSIEPICKRIYCGYPGYVAHGEIIGRSYYYGEIIKYVCHNEYKLVGDSERVCTENGTWSSTQPSCLGIQCRGFIKPDHSEISIVAEPSEESIENESDFDTGTEIEIKCVNQSEINGSSVLKCLENGTWNHPIPRCIKIKTPLLPCSLEQLPQPPINGYTELESLNAYTSRKTDVVHFKCRQGYQSHGTSVTQCIIDGYWTEISITCDPIICGNAPSFRNMHLKDKELLTNKYQFGNMAAYECAEGYRIFGNGVIRCLANGRWTRMQAKCLKKSCFKPKVEETTTVEGNSYLYGDQVTVTCVNKEKYILTCSSSGKWEGQLSQDC